MTLAEIGAQAGLATSTVGDLANGRSSSPRGDAALKLYQLHERMTAPAPKSRASA